MGTRPVLPRGGGAAAREPMIQKKYALSHACSLWVLVMPPPVPGGENGEDAAPQREGARGGSGRRSV